jgi:oxygen-dependent protoporphyrinogen oxidase
MVHMTAHDSVRTVAVIGGGITGLSTAYYIEKMAAQKGLPVRLVLLEADREPGGKIRTIRTDGFVIERGPDSFLARKSAALRLIRALGLEGELVGTNPRAKKTYILYKGKLRRIPAGLNIGVPTQFLPFATSTLLSWKGKIRAGLDLVIPAAPRQTDQSLGEFLERRLGTEVVDNIAEPLLAGIYAGDLRLLSLRATFPQLETLEQRYGSLVRGMAAQRKGTHANDAAGDGVPPSVFLSLRGGLQQLVEAMVRRLSHTDLCLGDPVVSLKQRDSGGFELIRGSGPMETADAVAVTIPTDKAFILLPDVFSEKNLLVKTPYVSVATVAFAFAAKDAAVPPDGTGFVVPRTEGRTMTACTWVSSKWLHTAPRDHVLLRCFVGRAGEEEPVEWPDSMLIRRMRDELADIMGVRANPVMTVITRWKRAMPQYHVGHLDRMAAFAEAVKKHYPGLFFAGAGFAGVGIPDCIAQGEQTASALVAYLCGQKKTEG